jgi:hypothetical protein
MLHYKTQNEKIAAAFAAKWQRRKYISYAAYSVAGLSSLVLAFDILL